MEMTCGSPYDRRVVCVTPERSAHGQFQVELIRKSPFSGSILSYPEALGYCTGTLVGSAIRLILSPLLGKAKSDWDFIVAALRDGIESASSERSDGNVG